MVYWILVGMDLGPGLREICAANRHDEKQVNLSCPHYIFMNFMVYLLCIFMFSVNALQQIKALLQSVGTSFCPNYLDWFGNEGSEPHSRNADRSVLTKFLQAHPADFSTRKLQVLSLSSLYFLL